MEIILKIYFLGLIAFVPNSDQSAVTALVVDARNGYSLSDGTWLSSHQPVLVVRSSRCSGPCLGQAQEAADFLFQNPAGPHDPAGSLRNLMTTIDQGAVWVLRDSDLHLEFDGSLPQRSAPLHIAGGPNPDQKSAGPPTNSQDMERFQWVANMPQIAPSAGSVDPDVLASRPSKGLIASRIRLDSGSIKAQRLVSLNDDVVPISFKPIGELKAPRKAWTSGDSYTGAVADWIVAEIAIPASTVRLRETDFDSGASRVIELHPERRDGQDVVELALINLPVGSFSATTDHNHEVIGAHFEIFYELSENRPPNRLRPVPFLADAKGLNWPLVRNSSNPRLLELLGNPKGRYAPPICPVARFSSAGQ